MSSGRCIKSGALALILASLFSVSMLRGGEEPVATEAVEGEWEFSLAGYGYFVPDGTDYFQPTLTVDRGWFHFEARWNYEDLETGSAWLGWNLSAGDTLALEFTPMFGGVFGETRGYGPGFRLSLDWRRLSFYSESEYIVDSDDDDDNFLYSWTELTYAPMDWLRFGLVGQRTRLYESGLEIDRGLILGLSWRNMEFTTCVFNLGWEEPTVVLGVAVSF